MSSAKIRQLGDRGILVEFDSRPSEELTGHMAAFCEASRALEGVIDAAPGHCTVLIEIEPAARDRLVSEIRQLSPRPRDIEGAMHLIQVKYDGEDLPWVCAQTGLGRDEVETIHSRLVYQVKTIGSPGFVYLSETDARLSVPRLDTPRTNVPAGAVGLAGAQTGLYGRSRPGGWRLIASATSIPKLVPGDRVRFVR